MPAYVRVRVTVTWTAPPSPVKPVELQTYVSRQYAGPQITNLELAPVDVVTGEIRMVPVTITATVALGEPGRARPRSPSTSFGENGMLGEAGRDVATGAAGNSSAGVYAITWDAAGAGDGKYSFRAQAYLANDDVGNTWARSATLNLTNGILPVTGLSVVPGDGTLMLSWDKKGALDQVRPLRTLARRLLQGGDSVQESHIQLVSRHGCHQRPDLLLRRLRSQR